MKNRDRKIAILGGGPAGLAVGHYARQRSLPFTIYESSDRWGGNCITHEWNEFRYDSGAHRLHGVDPDIVNQCARLLDGRLYEIDMPSRIFKNNRHFNFPLELKNIVRNMSLRDLTVGITDLLRASVSRNGQTENFEELAVRRYGKFFAKEFLLDYTEKLWGIPCADLDTSLTGKRLSGLNVMGLLKDMLLGNNAPRHMEGKFYYPEGGIGRLSDALAASCGEDRIRLGASVTRVFHDTNRIQAIELNNTEQVEVDEVVSSLPADRFLEMLEPKIVHGDGKESYYFRNLVLVTIFLKKEKVVPAASLYFPGADTVFTRAYEPRNRCVSMSPKGMSSLAAEIPCDRDSHFWTMPGQQVADTVIDSFCSFGWFKNSDVLGFEVKRLPDAYPVLVSKNHQFYADTDAALKKIENLKITGRNGRFRYSWIHDQLKWGQAIAEELCT
jgi:protoporphyrinogen oxidase